jgi:hypothetical protein
MFLSLLELLWLPIGNGGEGRVFELQNLNFFAMISRRHLCMFKVCGGSSRLKICSNAFYNFFPNIPYMVILDWLCFKTKNLTIAT